jgi:UDP-glucose 4-epimerase
MDTHLIIGGCGFIGRHLTVALVRRGHRVIVADPAPPCDALPPDVRDNVSFVTLGPDHAAAGDRAWDSLIARADAVHHLAWSTIPATANRDPIGDLDANVRSTLSLLEALRRRGGGRLIFASSGGTVYGRLHKIPVAENHPLEPLTAYGVTKLTVEKYCGLYRQLHGMDCRIARISNPFGAGQNPHREQGAAVTFVHRALSGQQIVVWGDGSVVRDYIHISDVGQGLAILGESPLERIGDRWIYNIGSGTGISLNEIIDMIGARLGRRIDVRYEPVRPFDVPVSVLDVTAARETLGWQPRLSFGEGLTAMIQDLRAQREFTPHLRETA